MQQVGVEVFLSKNQYQPGETIHGIVRLESPAGARCRAVRVFPHWSVRRDPIGDGGRGASVTVFEGELAAGIAVERAFALTAPAGPLSHAGSVVALEWQVVAQAELAWSLDASATQPFALATAEGSELLPGTGDYRRAPRFCSSAYVYGSRPVRRRRSIDLTEVSSFPFDGALRALAAGWRRLRFRPEVNAPSEVRRGEPFDVRVRMPSSRRPAAGGCEVRVIGQEVGLVGEPYESTCEVDLVHFDVDEAKPQGDTWVASFRIPETAPPTFSGRSSDIRYSLKIACGAESTELPLVVRP
jgi:hypothetical protein